MTYHDQELKKLKKKIALRDKGPQHNVSIAVDHEEKSVILHIGTSHLHLTLDGARQMYCGLGNAIDLLDPPKEYPVAPQIRDGASEG